MISLAILDKNRSGLLSCRDDGSAMQLLAGYLEGVTNRDSTMPNVQDSNDNDDDTDGKEKAVRRGISSFFLF